MVSVAQPARQIPATTFFNDKYSNETNHGSHRGPENHPPWAIERTRTNTEVPVKCSTNTGRRSVTSGTAVISPGSPASSILTSQQSVKALTCYFWATHGRCKWSDELCLYAHYHTGKIAQGPVQVEEGRPAVAGRNASNPHPVYKDWHKEHSLPSNSGVMADGQQQLEPTGVTAIHSILGTQVNDFSKNTKAVYPPNRSCAPTPVKSHIINRGLPDVSPTAPHRSGPMSPAVGDPISHRSQCLYQTASQCQPRPDPAANYTYASHHVVPQLSSGHHQANCSRPLDHLTLGSREYEQMMMMRTKNSAICELAVAFDLAIKTMEDSQKANHEEIQTLINVIRARIENAYNAQGQDDTAVGHDGAQKRKLGETSLASYANIHELPCKLTGVARKLSYTYETEKRTTEHLKFVKQKVATAFENIGDEDVLPQGWVQYGLPKQ